MSNNKFRSKRCLVWEEDGHRLNIYINAYLNVPVFDHKLKEYVAAGLNTVAAELRVEAAKDREAQLRQNVTMELQVEPVNPDEEKEMVREEKQLAKAQA